MPSSSGANQPGKREREDALLDWGRQECAIANFPLIERRSIVQQGAVASSQIIEHDDLFPFCSEAFHRHTANVARATCYQNRHNFLTF